MTVYNQMEPTMCLCITVCNNVALSACLNPEIPLISFDHVVIKV